MARAILTRVAPYSSVLVALLLMLPRLLSPEFGLLDDGVTIHSAREIARHPVVLLHLNAESGRFLPAYWLYNTAVYMIVWTQPFLFFLANYFLLAGTAFALVYFLLWRGASRLQAGAAGLLFVLSGPVIESFYTLSKGEPLQVLMLTTGLALTAGTCQAKRPPARILLFGTTFLCFFAACCSKETGVVLIPIGLGWLIMGHRAGADDRMGSAGRAVFATAATGAAGLFLFLRWMTLSTSVPAGSYTSGYRVSLERIVGSLSVWASWLVRDFPYLFPLALFVGWRLLRRQQPQARLLGDAVIWMVGWMAIFLPWQTTLDYYLLPFAIGCAVFGGIALGQLVVALRENPASRRLWASAAIVVLLFAATQANNATSARMQLSMDSANDDLIRFLAATPPNSTVFINLPKPSEYEYEVGVQLAELHSRPDITVDYFGLQSASTDTQQIPYYVATPVLENQSFPSPRYAVYESGARDWERSLLAFAGSRSGLVHETIREARVVDFGLHRLLCPFVKDGIYCAVGRPLVDTRLMKYGWRVYRISSGAIEMGRPAAPTPKLVAVRNPNGLETVGGDQFFWLGDQPATLVIDAGRAGPAVLKAKDFWFGPSAPGIPFRSLVTECGQHRIEYRFAADSKGVPLQLDSGTQECRIWCKDAPSVSKQPNGDTRVLLLGFKGYSIADAPDRGH